MRSLLIGFFALALAISASYCGHSSASFKHQKTDTSIKLCIFIKDLSGYGGAMAAQVICLDTFKKSQVDAETEKKIWVRDTLYNFLVYDSVRGKDGKVTLDTLGKPIIRPHWGLLIPKKYVQETTISFDAK